MIFIQSKLKSLPQNIEAENFDFDHPNSLDIKKLLECLEELLDTGETNIPMYCFKTNKRLKGQYRKLKVNQVLILEGVLILHDRRIRNLVDLKIFIHCDQDIALARRITRDISERGRDVKEVLTRYNKFVKVNFEKFVKPQMNFCDLIIPYGAENNIAFELIIDKVKLTILKEKQNYLLKQKSLKNLQRKQSSNLTCTQIIDLSSKEKIIEDTYQLMIQHQDHIYSKELKKILTKQLFKEVHIIIKKDLQINSSIKEDEYLVLLDEQKYIFQQDTKKLRFCIIYYQIFDQKSLEELKQLEQKLNSIPIYVCSFVSEKRIVNKMLQQDKPIKNITIKQLEVLKQVKQERIKYKKIKNNIQKLFC